MVAVGGTGSGVADVLPPSWCSCCGHALGSPAFRRIAGPAFSLVALGLVVCAGLASLVAGLVGVEVGTLVTFALTLGPQGACLLHHMDALGAKQYGT